MGAAVRSPTACTFIRLSFRKFLISVSGLCLCASSEVVRRLITAVASAGPPPTTAELRILLGEENKTDMYFSVCSIFIIYLYIKILDFIGRFPYLINRRYKGKPYIPFTRVDPLCFIGQPAARRRDNGNLFLEEFF